MHTSRLLKIATCCLACLVPSLAINAHARMLHIAHRGASADAPENTMAAFRLAIEQGCDGIECDVWLTKDGQLAVIHDANTHRVTGYKTNLVVTASTMEELLQLDVGSWKGSAYVGEKIPTLTEVLALARDNLRIYVELKQMAYTGVDAIVQTVTNEPNATPDRIVFIAFEMNSIQAIREALPKYEAYWLRNYEEFLENPSDLVQKLRNMNANGFSGSCITPETITHVITLLHQEGFSAHVWTEDTPNRAIQYDALGLDSLTSNKARLMLDHVFANKVPTNWFAAYLNLLAQHQGNHTNAAMAATGKLHPEGRPMRVWEDYIAGTDPTDPDDRVQLFVTSENGMPQFSWSHDLGTNRLYTVYGKENMADESWLPIALLPSARFFRVSVSLPE